MDGLIEQREDQGMHRNAAGHLNNLTQFQPMGDEGGHIAPPPDPFPTLRFLVLRLNHYFIPVIIVLGIVGNLFALVVFLGTYMRRRSVSVYLAALAISDTTFLVTLTVTWLEYVHVNVFHSNGWCQLIIYLSYCSSFLSVWFVVSFTVERYIAVCHPLKRPEMCTVGRARHVVIWLTVTCMLVYSVTLWTSGIVPILGVKGDRYYICTPLSKFLAVHTALTYADTIVTLLVPFLAILVLNIKIAHRIAYFYYHHRRRRATLHSLSQGSHLSRKTHPTSQAPLNKPSSAAAPEQLDNNAEARMSYSLCSKAQLQVTKMLLILSSLFLLINLPSYVLRLRLFILSVLHHQLDVKAQNFQMLLQQIFQLVYYTNFAMNFVLYSICSSKFRQAFCRFWKQMRRRAVSLCCAVYSSCCQDQDQECSCSSCCCCCCCCLYTEEDDQWEVTHQEVKGDHRANRQQTKQRGRQI